jgi:O-antigen ligase
MAARATPPWNASFPTGRGFGSTRLRYAALIAVALLVNAIALVALSGGHKKIAIVIMLAPVIVVAVASLAATDGTSLVIAALILQMTIQPLNNALPLGSSIEVFPSDIVIVLAIAAWFADRALLPAERRAELTASRRLSPILGLPLLLFTFAIAYAAIRGHDLYGASLIGRPMRMFLYAAIALAIVRTEPRRLYRAIVIAFYAGAVWQLFNAFYYLGTGRSQSIAPDLSTGGTRVLSIAVSFYIAGTFFLALINLSMGGSGPARLLHGTMLILSAVEIGLAFSRGTFITVALLATILFLFLRDVRIGTVAALPLAIPILAVGVLVLARTDSTVIPTFVERINPSITHDQSVRWREKANAELVKQFHESPFTGVGFGRNIHFVIDFQQVDTSQQAHNDFLYILAGAGILGIGSFLLVIGAGIVDALRRLRRTTVPHERALLLFGMIMLATFVLNGLVEPLITLPTILLSIWTVLLLPMAVPQGQPEAVTEALPRAARATT